MKDFSLRFCMPSNYDKQNISGINVLLLYSVYVRFWF